ncbi:isoprenyl transferase [Brevibacterium sp. 50QC2O2]|jgi:short-chain Z-isoprenyl diphosphate synthase|uniref:isoprenyl transferase n=1 Tax=Brevibacterium TaxID=1696 RepID=UPI00211BB2E8|nr:MULTISPECIES: isoprenyl transferase [unclassified Brevibacterium]MCQ9368515.1 isoprenyl transferase [Brevibacterium sp. 91QC2O2]MCQ9385905.1 isoprenyl transferase [Brevibacterium sp. 68QC2CO]MCQ9387429.1 isoprenyl transferase [Brevibacterium sp. 50QC2O2]
MYRPAWLYRMYERKVLRQLARTDAIPHHVGVITDGNRRWAREFGTTTAHGHQAGANKIIEFLGWCSELGISVVTLYVLSKENLTRDESELGPLKRIISNLVDQIADTESYAVKLVGDLRLLPDDLRRELAAAQQRTPATGRARLTVNVAVGYGGREEIVDAVKSWMRSSQAAGLSMQQMIDDLTPERISEHLYTKGQPDPDLIIRTSGEQRLSGFMMWQSAYSEFYFCEVYWPDFRRTDFLRAVRDFSSRGRRYGK